MQTDKQADDPYSLSFFSYAVHFSQRCSWISALVFSVLLTLISSVFTCVVNVFLSVTAPIGREARLPLTIKAQGLGPNLQLTYNRMDMKNVDIGGKDCYEVRKVKPKWTVFKTSITV